MSRFSVNFQESPLHASTVSKTKDADERGAYYNAAYEIENFIQIYQDDAQGDPFRVLTDPTWTGFKLFFHFNASSGLLADEQFSNSALAYLKRIGQTKRYELLQRFIKTLSAVNSITPWIFQDIEGLQDAWTRKRTDILCDKELTIKTLETIDNKIGSLNKMYRDISFDETRWAHVLPENLRRFSMSVYVYDFRTFDDLSKTAFDFLQTLRNTDVKQLNHTMFDLGYCQFTTDSGKDFFETITNNPTAPNANNLTIKFESVHTSAVFKSISGSAILSSNELSKELASASTLGQLTSSSDKKLIDRLSDRIKNNPLVEAVTDQYQELTNLDTLKAKLGTVVENTAESILDRLESALTGLYLGNIHGFGFDDIVQLAQNPNGFKEDFIRTYSALPQNNSLAFGNTQRDNLGNVND